MCRRFFREFDSDRRMRLKRLTRSGTGRRYYSAIDFNSTVTYKPSSIYVRFAHIKKGDLASNEGVTCSWSQNIVIFRKLARVFSFAAQPRISQWLLRSIRSRYISN